MNLREKLARAIAILTVSALVFFNRVMFGGESDPVSLFFVFLKLATKTEYDEKLTKQGVM
ncbi:hypothetical protein ES702_00558 [subsurface metagenome]